MSLNDWLKTNTQDGVLTKELLDDHFLQIQWGKFWGAAKEIRDLPVYGTSMAQPLAETPSDHSDQEASQK